MFHSSGLRARVTRCKDRFLRGFTLLELMVVVAIVGVLSAVVLPQYLRSRARAEAASMISEAQALAKQCTAGMRSSIGMTGTDPFTGSSFTCDGAGDVYIFSRQWSSDAAGAACLASTALSWHSLAVFIVSRSGDISCIFLRMAMLPASLFEAASLLQVFATSAPLPAGSPQVIKFEILS
ncbi:MAG: hypothetical protein ER33_16015 [Cyanobium sp. CACIAM 14]|nr:MAG: hypothetical protein ER33_16015 [Cyanobium sp. CACIAM 14]